MTTLKYEDDYMWKKLQEMAGYLANRYNGGNGYVQFAYNGFLPLSKDGQEDSILYKVFGKSGKKLFQVYYKYSTTAHYINIETEPEYIQGLIESVCDKVGVRKPTKECPGIVLKFTNMDIIFDELVKICDCIDNNI